MSSGWWRFVEGVMERKRWSAAELARQMGIDSSVITGWKQGNQPTTDKLRQFSEATGEPMLRLLVEAGHLTEAEAGGEVPESPVAAPIDVLAAIEADDQLLDEAKLHLTNQYGLLLRVSPRRTSAASGTPAGQPQLRAVARKGTPRSRRGSADAGGTP